MHVGVLYECQAAQMCEDSIQELNNLIGELDSFQKEHEMKMREKEREKQLHLRQQQKLNHTASSMGDISDIQSNFDRLSINSNDPNPVMCSTGLTFDSDVVDSPTDLTDCQATTKSLKLNLSTTEYPLHLHSIVSNNSSNKNISDDNISSESKIVHNIELIPESYNVSDNYVKEHTEIVVLRRKESISEVNEMHTPTKYSNSDTISNGSEVERALPITPDSSQNRSSELMSFRCSSFSSKTDLNPQILSPTSKAKSAFTDDSCAGGDEFSSKNCTELTNGTAVMLSQYDQNTDDHADSESNKAMQIRKKPSITPRPASLSGLFVHLFSLYFFIIFLFFSIFL